MIAMLRAQDKRVVNSPGGNDSQTGLTRRNRMRYANYVGSRTAATRAIPGAKLVMCEAERSRSIRTIGGGLPTLGKRRK